MEQSKAVPKVCGSSQEPPPQLAQLLYSPIHIHSKSPASASLKLQWKTVRMETAGRKEEHWSLQKIRDRTGTHGWYKLGSQDLRALSLQPVQSSAEGNLFTFEVQCHFKIPSQEGQIKL